MLGGQNAVMYGLPWLKPLPSRTTADKPSKPSSTSERSTGTPPTQSASASFEGQSTPPDSPSTPTDFSERSQKSTASERTSEPQQTPNTPSASLATEKPSASATPATPSAPPPQGQWSTPTSLRKQSGAGQTRPTSPTSSGTIIRPQRVTADAAGWLNGPAKDPTTYSQEFVDSLEGKPSSVLLQPGAASLIIKQNFGLLAPNIAPNYANKARGKTPPSPIVRGQPRSHAIPNRLPSKAIPL